MKLPLMDKYSDEEFKKIVAESKTYKDCLLRLGYVSNSGDNTNRLKKKIQDMGLDTSHFEARAPARKLSPEIIFVEDSTVDQEVLRRWYKNGNYSPYKCAICGQEPIWQGKPMTLILDHINGRNKDDRLENLRWVCGNCNMQLDTTNGKNKIRQKVKEKGDLVSNVCIDCGTPISKGSVRCRKCWALTQEKELPITREELKALIRITPFTKIGEKFNVTDNAIRKWCDKYSLPRKAIDIKQYSDEEWEKI